jgi:hypothetical protein
VRNKKKKYPSDYHRGWKPHGRLYPQTGAQAARQSDMGANLGESPGHANEVEIMRPAKLTAHRDQARAMYMGGAHQACVLVWVV